MNVSHLLSELRLAKNVVLAAAPRDPKRAFIEAGGYVDALFGHAFGRHVITQWRSDFELRLRTLESVRRLLADRIGRVGAALRPRLAPLAVSNESARHCIEFLDQADSALSSLGTQPVMLFEFFTSIVWSNLELGIFVLAGADPTFDRVEQVGPPFQEAIAAGDAGDTNDLARQFTAVKNAIVANAAASHWTRPKPTIDRLAAHGDIGPAELVQFLLGDMPLALNELKNHGIEPMVPALSYYQLLGGAGAERLRNALLLPGPRHPWWSLTQLVALSLFVESDTSILTADAQLLKGIWASVRETVKNDRDASKRAAQLVLELTKVDEAFEADCAEGRVILADLQRYRQRMEYYDVDTLARLVSRKVRTPREDLALRHLATWLADHGYTPLSKNLGRGRTDLEGEDTRGAFVLEAKILLDATAPKTQATLDKASQKWAAQAIDYADGQGVDLVFVVVFNATTDSSFVAAPGPHLVGDERIRLYYFVVNATKKPPSRARGSVLTVHWPTATATASAS